MVSDVCTRKGCNQPVHRRIGTGQYYCIECSWLATRLTNSTEANKITPTWDELKSLMEVHCPVCFVKMVYEGRMNKRKLATLQHNNDGTLTVICHACNVGHGRSKLGDAYFDIPRDHKYCSKCECIQPRDNFYNNRATQDKLSWFCKDCQRQSNLEWRIRKRQNGCIQK